MNEREPRKYLKGIAVGAASVLASATLAACGDSGSGVPSINLYGGAAAAGFDKIIDDCNKQANGEYKIVPNLLPSTADGQREQLVRRLAAKDDSMDLIGMDVVWTAEFAEAGWVRELTDAQKEAANKDTLPAPIATATWKGKQYGVSKHTNVQLLWYRKSLVPTPPKTWDEVVEMSTKLKSDGKPHVIAMTAAQYEGYVVGFNTILASVGGTLLNEGGTEVTVDDKTVKALDILHNLATGGLASKSLSNSTETEVFGQIQSNEAAFAMNWPYVLSAMRTAGKENSKYTAIADDLGYTKLPEFQAGEPARATLGGMNYAISSYSKHPKETFDAAMCLRTPEHQLQTSIDAGDPPVAPSVYEQPEFKKAYPMGPVMLEQLKTPSSRPATPLYQNVSTIVSTTLSPPSSINPEKTADELKDSIQQALDGKGILP